jgi:DNA-binding XRE family transcriptional regulator
MHKNVWTNEQLAYIDWLAMSKELRVEHGKVKTKKDYAIAIGVSRGTLWDWENLDGFRDAVAARTKEYFKSDLPDIVQALIKVALRGNVNAIKLSLEMGGMYTPKQITEIDGELTGLVINTRVDEDD